VIGSRYTEGGAIPGDWPLRRIVNSRVANFVAKSVGGIRPEVKDVSGGFKAIRASKLKDVDWRGIQTAGYAFQMHLLHTFMQGQAVIREVPITFIDRREGLSKLRTSDILEFIRVAYGLDATSPARRLIRFVSVGASGIVVNLGVLALLATTTTLHLVLASAIAIEVSILSNFFLHNRYTFYETEQGVLRKLAAFNLASLGTASLSLAVFYVLHGMFGLHYLVAQLIAIVAAFALNYQISARVIWKDRRLG
jgi:dolichol-phosphate mannosyltransferase